MTQVHNRVGLTPQFLISTTLAFVALVAMAGLWITSARRTNAMNERLVSQLQSAQSELKFSKSRVDSRPTAQERTRLSKGLLSETDLRFINFRNARLTTGNTAFAGSTFDGGDFSNAVITAGDSSFQNAHFNKAILTDATLEGGVGAFQLASFENADLSGATLAGVGSAFQCASFANAKLHGTRFKCTSGTAFQAANIDGAQFDGADLSMLDRQSLESCYFDTPPTYDDRTSFPSGFDPVARMWTRSAK
jgi:uncharacterized protein YjbI with pentapeptide repeats